jgi:hypothetical protein
MTVPQRLELFLSVAREFHRVIRAVLDDSFSVVVRQDEGDRPDRLQLAVDPLVELLEAACFG